MAILHNQILAFVNSAARDILQTETISLAILTIGVNNVKLAPFTLQKDLVSFVNLASLPQLPALFFVMIAALELIVTPRAPLFAKTVEKAFIMRFLVLRVALCVSEDILHQATESPFALFAQQVL